MAYLTWEKKQSGYEKRNRFQAITVGLLYSEDHYPIILQTKHFTEKCISCKDNIKGRKECEERNSLPASGTKLTRWIVLLAL